MYIYCMQGVCASYTNFLAQDNVYACTCPNCSPILKFYNFSSDAKRVVQAPPSSSFYGQKLKVTLKHSESVPGDMSDYKSKFGMKYSSAHNSTCISCVHVHVSTFRMHMHVHTIMNCIFISDR